MSSTPTTSTPRVGTRFQSGSTGALVEVVAVDDTDVHYRFLPSGDESYPLTREKFMCFFHEVQQAEVGEILVIKCVCHGPCAHCGHSFNRCLPSRTCPKCGHPLNVRFLNCELATPENPIHEPREP